jgi:hypothetical protein
MRKIIKKLVNISVAAVILFSFAACGTADNTVMIPPEQYEMLNQKHIEPLMISVIIASNWTDANEIEPHRFMNYYAVMVLRSNGFSEDFDGSIPAVELESFVQDHFDVTTEHLRQNRYYNADRNVYEFDGLGSTAYSVVTGAVQNGGLLSISYDIFGPADYLIAAGVLVIEINGEDYKYVRNQLERSVQSHLAFPSAIGETDQNGVFMLESEGTVNILREGEVREYNGEDLLSIIAYYENEVLPALEAQGSADLSKHEDGWYWSGTYHGGNPLTIEIRRKIGSDTYIIAATYTENAGVPNWDSYNII